MKSLWKLKEKMNGLQRILLHTDSMSARAGNILVFVVAFFLGMLVCVSFFKFQGGKNDEKLVLNLLKEQNNNLSWLTEKHIEESIKYSADTTRQEILLLKDMNMVSNYFNDILSSKEYDSFSIDTVKAILDNSIRWVEYHEKIKQISLKQNTSIENELYLNVFLNIILNKCFRLYKEYALMVSLGEYECVLVPIKKSVKTGDFYEAKIYFSVKDFSQTYTIVDTVDFQTISEGDVYREKATTKGLNTRNGLLRFFNGYETLYFPVEFSFYVE